ncbi:MAG: 3-deoxy-8-phosphooctulonate synthase [Rhodospirillales bacterium]|nr:3-deoxy-8-phosphooctulonate synthase [Rhodospirillales bacterium]MBO6786763.1 3-deoxy-8-phosphooctulonate synthase [Rhodospirillales bacterium]
MTEQRTVDVGPVSLSNQKPLGIIAGPCQLETREHTLEMACRLKELADKLGIGIIYKTSYDKANRTSLKGKRGIGLEDALPIFKEVTEVTGLPVLTDVHEPAHCAVVAEAVSILQIPAFLCRQTDLLLAAGNTNKPINIKKGQFLAPWDMKNVVDKVLSTGNDQVTVTERGASFGYNTLVTDFRGLPTMKAETGCPIVFDATHSVQQPGGQGGSSGGQREFAPVLARAAVSLGIAAVFMETHQDPDNAPSDGPNMIPVANLENVIKDLMAFDNLAKSQPAPESLATGG